MAKINGVGLPEVATIHSKVTAGGENPVKYAKPGDILKYRGVFLRVVEAKRCKDCYFDDGGFCQRNGHEKSWGPCCGYNRPDKVWIAFRKVEEGTYVSTESFVQG